MTIMAIEATQAHLEDLHREAAQRRRAAAARRAGVDNANAKAPATRARGFQYVRRVLGARS